MAVHMMRGRFIPLPQGAEIQFFEDISQEIESETIIVHFAVMLFGR